MTTLRYPHLYRHSGLVRYYFGDKETRIALGVGPLISLSEVPLTLNIPTLQNET